MDPVSLATGGLFFSWLAHDLEELATMPGWTHPLFDKVPFLPEDIRRHGCSREHVYLGIGLMGVLMAVASIDGYRTRGRSPVYQPRSTATACTPSATWAQRPWPGATPRGWPRRCQSSCPSGSSRSGRCELMGSRCAPTDG